MPQDPKVLKRERRESLACLLACGVGPGGSLEAAKPRATLFFQEEVCLARLIGILTAKVIEALNRSGSGAR